TPILPLMPVGSPGLSLRSIHVSPPSVDCHRPLSGPPLEICEKLRYACQIDAYRMRGLVSSIDRSTAPALSLLNSTFRHVAPPSTDLNTPRSLFGPKACPSAATYTISGLSGWTRILPIKRVSARPMCAHVRPASVDL